MQSTAGGGSAFGLEERGTTAVARGPSDGDRRTAGTAGGVPGRGPVDAKAAAWCSFLRAYERLHTRIGHALQQDCGLSLADVAILTALSGADDVRVKDLARDLQWERSRLSHQLTRMAERGLVDREDDPRDGRATRLILTEQGRRVVGTAGQQFGALVDDLFLAELGPEQLATLTEILDHFLATAPWIGQPGESTGPSPHAAEDAGA